MRDPRGHFRIESQKLMVKVHRALCLNMAKDDAERLLKFKRMGAGARLRSPKTRLIPTCRPGTLSKVGAGAQKQGRNTALGTRGAAR